MVTLRPLRRGFTLMESLMASAILFAGVLAVISAVMTGQNQAFEAQRRLAATLAADELMSEIVTIDYSQIIGLPTLQPVGEFWAIMTDTPEDQDLPALGVVVRGMSINIRIVPSLAEATKTLAEIEFFVPEPAS